MRKILVGAVAASMILTVTACSNDRANSSEGIPARIPNLACLEAATTLTEHQKKSLQEGRETRISREHFDFLTTALAGFEGSTWNDVSDDAAVYLSRSSYGDDGRHALASALMLVTNPKVRGADLPGGNDAGSFSDDCLDETSQVGAESGGFDALPVSLRSSLTEKPIGWDSLGPWEAARPELRTEGELSAASKLLALADEEVAQGSDLDRVLIGRAGEIAHVAVDQGWGTFRASGEFFDFSRRRIGDLLSAMIDAAGRDQLALHDALSGTADGGEVVPGGGYGPFERDGRPELRSADYQRTTAIPALLAFDWDESAGQDRSLLRMLRRIGTSDVMGEENGGTSESNGEELARIVANRSEFLTRIPGYSELPLGVLNPRVTDALAAATVPHMLDASGRLDGYSEFSRMRVAESDIQRTATVLSTNEQSLQTMVSTAIDMVAAIQQGFVGLPDRTGDDEFSMERPYALLDHLRLERGIERGIGVGLQRVAEAGLGPQASRALDHDVYYDASKSAYAPAGDVVRVDIGVEEPAMSVRAAPVPPAYLRRPGEMRPGVVTLATRNPTSAWSLVNLALGAPKPGRNLDKYDFASVRSNPDALAKLGHDQEFQLDASRALGEDDDDYLDLYELYENDY